MHFPFGSASFIGGRGWIRTIEGGADGFTVRSIWPLWNSSLKKWSWWSESNQQPADYKSAALPLSHTSILFGCIKIKFRWCLGAESNHRHEDFQSSALPTELPRHNPNIRRPSQTTRGHSVSALLISSYQGIPHAPINLKI